MILKEIQLSNFRNHTDTKVYFSSKVNMVSGNNGQGKTNLLEAISYSCLTKSMFTHRDTEVLQSGKSWFSVFATLYSDIEFTYKNQVRYNEEKKEKSFIINNIEMEPLSSVIGKFPMVFLSPELSIITTGGPAERRRFLDILLSQSSKVYLENIIDFRRIVKQRNAILSNTTLKEDRELLEPWNELLVERGSKIINHRIELLSQFKTHLIKSYSDIAGQNEIVNIEYKSSISENEGHSISSIQEKLRSELKKERPGELYKGTTLVGPHRDDLLFTINNHPFRQFASQGQHKTLLIALKIAEYYFLQDTCRETPIVLLDDVFSELDNSRTNHLLDKLSELGQTFISTTLENTTTVFGGLNLQIETIVVKNGAVFKEKDIVVQ